MEVVVVELLLQLVLFEVEILLDFLPRVIPALLKALVVILCLYSLKEVFALVGSLRHFTRGSFSNHILGVADVFDFEVELGSLGSLRL